MRFRTYQGARAGLGQMMAALAAPGGNVYGDQMRDLAYVDSAQAGARRDDSETALNQQTFGARSNIRSALDGVQLPQGMTPDLAASLYVGSENPNFRDFTQGMVDLGGTEAQRMALDAAKRGDNDAMNRFNTIAKPGTQYTPFTVNETASYNTATGAGQFTPGHGALVNQRNAAAGASAAAARASDAHAGLYNAQADAARFMEVSPGATVYQQGQRDLASMPGTIGAMPDGRPIIQNDDGTISTHRMATVQDPRLNAGKATNVPTMVNGQQMSVQDAIAAAVAAGGNDPTTGQPMQSYGSMEEAETDYLLRQHPQIDREASWRQRQYQERAGGRQVPTLVPMATAPMTPRQQGAGSGGAGGAGGADATAKQKRYNELVSMGMSPRAAQAAVDGTLVAIQDATGLVKGFADKGTGQTVATVDKNGMLQHTEYGKQFYGTAQAAGGDPLAEARAAIAQGAPRAAVIQRLQQMGIDPGGL